MIEPTAASVLADIIQELNMAYTRTAGACLTLTKDVYIDGALQRLDDDAYQYAIELADRAYDALSTINAAIEAAHALFKMVGGDPA